MEPDATTQNATHGEHLSVDSPASGNGHDGRCPDVSANEQPAKCDHSKGGAPPGNANSLRHGLKGDPEVSAYRLILGSLPPSLAKVERQSRQFRIAVEQAVIETHGTISLTHACIIATAARWERHSSLALRWLRERYAELGDDQRLTFSREVAKASAERDKSIAALKLDRDAKESIFDLLYGTQPPEK